MKFKQIIHKNRFKKQSNTVTRKPSLFIVKNILLELKIGIWGFILKIKNDHLIQNYRVAVKSFPILILELL